MAYKTGRFIVGRTDMRGFVGKIVGKKRRKKLHKRYIDERLARRLYGRGQR